MRPRTASQPVTIEQAKAGVMEWVSRLLIALIAYLAINIHQDVNTLLVKVPVLEQRIKTLEENCDRFKPANASPARKPDEITFLTAKRKI